MPKIAAGATNKNISLAPNGTGKVVVGTGAADATVQSDGDHNLILQTGNSTTGKIEIVDGANGNIDITPNGTGEVDISKVDIDGGAIDGITLGTNSAVTEAQIDNINIDGNEITSTDTNGNIDLTPNGTGEVNISKVDIDGGAIDGTNVTVGSGKTLDVSAGTLTTSTAQKQAIIDGATVLPSQTGNADKILKTSGSAASWTATRKLLASTDGIQRSDGTAVLSEDGSNVATLNNVVLASSIIPVGHLIGFAKFTYDGSTNIDIPEADTDFGINLQITIPAGYTTADFLLVTCQIPQCFNQSYSGRRIKAGFRYATVADFSSGVAQFGPTEFLVDHIAYSSVTQDKYELLYYTVYDNVKSTSAHYIRPLLRAEGNTMKAFAVSANGGFLTAQIIKG